jgi:hypothetical protein
MLGTPLPLCLETIFHLATAITHEIKPVLPLSALHEDGKTTASARADQIPGTATHTYSKQS